MDFSALFTLEGAPFAEGHSGVHVYRAERIEDRRKVAVKVVPLPLDAKMNKKLADALTLEYTSRMRLGDHPYIVPSMGLFWEAASAPSAAATGSSAARVGGRGLLVMAYAEGGCASTRLAGAWGLAPGVPSETLVLFSAPEVVAIAHNIVSALAHVHAHGVYHFDVKPSNVLLMSSARGVDGARSAVLADFGSARVARALGKTTTKGAALAGTEAFMAPEMLTRRGCKDRADVWSAGATLLALLTGVELGGDDDMQAAWAGALDDGAADWDREAFFAPESPAFDDSGARAAWAAAPADLRALIVACLALRPEMRPSAEELLALPVLRAEAEAARALREARRAEAEAAAERAPVEAAVAAPLRARIRNLEESLEVSGGRRTGDPLEARGESCIRCSCCCCLHEPPPLLLPCPCPCRQSSSGAGRRSGARRRRSAPSEPLQQRRRLVLKRQPLRPVTKRKPRLRRCRCSGRWEGRRDEAPPNAHAALPSPLHAQARITALEVRRTIGGKAGIHSQLLISFPPITPG